MSEEDFAALKDQVEGLKLALTKKEAEAQQTAANIELMELELKKLLKQSKDESAEGKGPGEEKEHVVYVTPSRKLERFKGKPAQGTDPSVEEWIEDAKAICESKGLKKEQTALFLLEHLAGEARREILGRGNEIKSNPDQIFAVLLRVFGDGDSLPQLQQQFFSYRQKEGEDLVSCSLHLVRLFDRIIQLDSSFKPGRDAQLKSRLAEAVREESLRTELRRLNSEHPELTYFDVRDRVMKLMSKPPVKQSTLVQETAAAGQDIHSILRQQSQQIAAQQKQIESLVSALSSRDVSSRGGGQRRCWVCGSAQHLRRDCPKRVEDIRPAAPSVQTGARGENLN